MEKSNKVLVGSLAVVMVGAFTISSAMAYQGDYSKQGPAYSPERHSAMEEAISNNNYKAWSELMTDRGRITKVINEKNFAQFAKAHELAHNGDLEGADAIRQKLKIRTGNGKKVGVQHGKKQDKNREEKRGNERMNNEDRGQNQNGKFIDANSDGICDNL